MTLLSSEDLVERVARIIREPGLGYSITLVQLVGGVSTYLADVDGDGPREFPSYGDALDHAQNLSALARARSAIAAFPDLSVLQGENERLRGALRRLGSMEAFDVSRSIDPRRDAELLARIDYARAALSLLPDLGEEQTVSQSQPSGAREPISRAATTSEPSGKEG